MSMGALSFVMLVWRGMSSTSVRVSTHTFEWTTGSAITTPGPFIPSNLPKRKRAIRS